MQTVTHTSDSSRHIGMPSSERDLPIEIILGAAKYADEVRGTDRMVSSSQVMDIIAEKRGWK